MLQGRCFIRPKLVPTIPRLFSCPNQRNSKILRCKKSKLRCPRSRKPWKPEALIADTVNLLYRGLNKHRGLEVHSCHSCNNAPKPCPRTRCSTGKRFALQMPSKIRTTLPLICLVVEIMRFCIKTRKTRKIASAQLLQQCLEAMQMLTFLLLFGLFMDGSLSESVTNSRNVSFRRCSNKKHPRSWKSNEIGGAFRIAKPGHGDPGVHDAVMFVERTTRTRGIYEFCLFPSAWNGPADRYSYGGSAGCKSIF